MICDRIDSMTRRSLVRLRAMNCIVLLTTLIAVTDPAQSQSNLPDYSRQVGFHEIEVSLSDTKPHIEWMFLPSGIRRDDSGRINMPRVSQAVVAEDQLYFMTEGPPCTVYALSAQNGRILWRFNHLTRGYNGDPSVDQQRVYFGSKAGVTALARKDGRFLWHFPMEHGHGEGAPLPIDGRVFVSGYDGFSYALDCNTGEPIWKHNLVDAGIRDPEGFDGERARFSGKPARPRGSASDGKIFVQSVFDQSRLVAMDCQTGERRWEFQAKGWIGPAPTIVGAQVFICSQDKFLYCLDRVTGKELWKFETPTWNSSRVAVHNGVVYLPVHRGRMYQLESNSGNLLHAFDLPQAETGFGSVYTFPIVHGNNVLYVEGNGQVLNLDAKNNRLHWQFRPRQHSELFTDPVTDGKRIYVTSRQDDGLGESSVVALGFEEQPTASVFRSDVPGIETLFDDLAKIELAQQSGLTGQLYYLAATGQFCIVFPETGADWNVIDQLSAARAQATQYYSDEIEWLFEEAKLDADQELKLMIASNRAYQESIRELRDLKSDLGKTTAQEFKADDVKRRFELRCDVLSASIARFQPLARGSAVYRVLPSVLRDDQSLAFKRHLLEQNSAIYRALELTPTQEKELKNVFEELTENPLDLRCGQIAITLRQNPDMRDAMRAVLVDEQHRIWQSWN